MRRPWGRSTICGFGRLRGGDGWYGGEGWGGCRGWGGVGQAGVRRDGAGWGREPSGAGAGEARASGVAKWTEPRRKNGQSGGTGRCLDATPEAGPTDGAGSRTDRRCRKPDRPTVPGAARAEHRKAGQRHSHPGPLPAVAALGDDRPAARADNAYGSRNNRACPRRRGIRATTPVAADRVHNRQRSGPRGGRPPALERLTVGRERPRRPRPSTNGRDQRFHITPQSEPTSDEVETTRTPRGPPKVPQTLRHDGRPAEPGSGRPRNTTHHGNRPPAGSFPARRDGQRPLPLRHPPPASTKPLWRACPPGPLRFPLAHP